MFAASKTDGSAVAPDAQFNYVTMLLHGDGTNGAQNNTFVDGSTNNFSITRNGNTTQGSFSPYGSGWSNYFNGSTDYLRYAGQSAFSFGTGDFTIEGWFFVNSLASGILAWDFRNSGGTNGAFPTLELSTNGQVQYFSDSAYRISSSSGLLTANTWAHIAVTRSGTSTKLFFNGTQAGSTYSDSTNYTVGAGGPYIGSGSAPSAYLTGYISNFRVVKGTAVYTSNFTPSTTPLTSITNTSLLTCQSNRFIDNSANNFTATIGGTPSVQRFNPFGTSTAYSTSVIGGSGYFDGTGDYLTIPSTSAFNFGSNNFTVEFWLRTNVATGNIINPTTSGNWALFLINGNFNWNDAYNVTNLFSVSATSVINNAWHHIAYVRSSGTIYVYFDGVLQTSNADPTVYTSSGSTWNIGNGNVGDFNGYISDMRINNGTAVYTSAFTPPTAPLTAITNTQLLCNMTNGAIFDNAMMNNLETVGNAQISTSVKKYGTGSMYFDGTGDYLKVANSPILQFGTGDFTVEGWFYLTTATYSNNALFSIGSYNGGILLRYVNGGTDTLYINGTQYQWNPLTNFPLNQWNHVAMVRNGSAVAIYVNGTSVFTTTSSVSIVQSTATSIGTATHDPTGENWTGYIDDFRITKGYARYTANFTAPTSALSDTGPI